MRPTNTERDTHCCRSVAGGSATLVVPNMDNKKRPDGRTIEAQEENDKERSIGDNSRRQYGSRRRRQFKNEAAANDLHP